MPSFLWGKFRYAIVDENIFSFIRTAFDNPSILVAMNLTNEDLTVNFQLTRMMPSKIKVVYYFDNKKNSDNWHKINTDIATKNIFLAAKSCLIAKYFWE